MARKGGMKKIKSPKVKTSGIHRSLMPKKAKVAKVKMI